jgi:toxin secretion/phage lysis holin
MHAKTPEGMMNLPMDSIVEWIRQASAQYPVVGILLVLMGIDILMGFVAAVITKTVSSTISQNGMSRKAGMLLIVGAGAALKPYTNGLPLSELISTYYLWTEAISICENATRAGIPVPDGLREMLVKLKSDKASVPIPPPSRAAVEIMRASNVSIATSDGSQPVQGHEASIHDSGPHRAVQAGDSNITIHGAESR